MSKRSIRLKEIQPNLKKSYSPSEEYFQSTTGLQRNEIYPIETDSEGMQFSILARQESKDIYLLGDSTVESIYMRPSMRPHVSLDYLLLKNGYNYSVFNLGYSGAHTLSIINVLINKLGDKKGSTLIITLPSNDLSALSFEGNYFNAHWRYSSIIPALDKKVIPVSNISYEPYIRNLKLILNICDALEVKLFFTTIVYTGIDSSLKKLNDIIRSFCKLENVSLIDFEDFFVYKPELFYDKLHFLTEGSKIYSQRIFESIKYGLEKSKLDVIKNYNIVNDVFLGENIHWSTFFSVKNYSFMKVVIDTEFGLDADTKQAILTVDYNGVAVNSKLARSLNTEIGYFSYINGQKNTRMEVLLHIDIPLNCSKMRLGLRSWSSKNIQIHRSFVTLVKV